jgi:hypothetical protein
MCAVQAHPKAAARPRPDIDVKGSYNQVKNR